MVEHQNTCVALLAVHRSRGSHDLTAAAVLNNHHALMISHKRI